jgi:hypothetical protein
MNDNENCSPSLCPARCCPCGEHGPDAPPDITRRGFLESTAITGLALRGLSWSALSAAESEESPAPHRRRLVQASRTPCQPGRSRLSSNPDRRLSLVQLDAV